MRTAAYKLNEYRIIEDENGLLWWETHYGFGVQRRGMGFIHDDILIIGPCSHEEIGYLKGEFLDRLEELPLWNKTKYYCLASELFDVASGRSLNDDFLDGMFSSANTARNRAALILNRGPGTFRLDKCQIIVATNGQVSWQAHGGMNRVIAGQCTIQSGVLFIGPEEQEKEKETKGDFQKKLTTLPGWDRTKMWSPGLVLRPCQAQPERGRLEANSGKARLGDIRAYFEELAAKHARQRGGQLRGITGSSFKFRKPSWNRIRVPSALKFRKPSWPLCRKGKHGLNG